MSPRPPALPLLLSTALLAGLVACSAGADEGGSSPASPAADRSTTVEHLYGTTEVTGVPERVVAIDLQWTDTLLALGVDPVGYTVEPSAEPYPWQELPAGATVIELDGDFEVPVEQVAALEPDLILGSWSIGDQATYDLLSGIAPTVPALDAEQVTAWQDLVDVAGQLLDREEEAAALVAEVDGQVAETAADLPGLAGRTFVLAQYVVGDSIYAVADRSDGSSVFFQDLGMQLHQPVVDEGQAQAAARVSLSVERADLLGADLVAFLVNGGDAGATADIPGFDQLPGTVAILDLATIVGLNTPTPLSLPYSLEALRPYLEDAAA
ncbi:ABC transporter substrate-binding protein [Modestobacter versicolor]|uniref:ABC transporter substrate-binding protein n=1 Tax=Modestobacter versicolor TaxID=429133 RepID=UPI0034DEA741